MAQRSPAALVAFAAAICLAASGAYAQADRSQGRSTVFSRFGIVAAEQPLAAEAGAAVLARGGTAADAAVAANAVMGVVAPMMDGLGGDLAALVYDPRSGDLVGLDATGWAPAALSIGTIKARDGDRLPARGVDAVTVPGAVEGWAKLLGRFGHNSPAEVLAPAIALADEGFPVSEIFADTWAGPASLGALRQNPEASRVFLPGGRPPRAGEVFRNPDLARTLRAIAAGGRDAFYAGDVARRILQTSARLGGSLSPADLADYRADWVAPLTTTYRGWTVAAMPPATMGVAALEMLNVMERFPLADYGRGSAQALHVEIEAAALAYADADRFDADPRAGPVPVAGLLDKGYAGRRAAAVDPARASCQPGPGRPAEPSGDTTVVTAVDRDGLMVSLMQSNFWEFGTGIVPDGTGFALQNRGRLFSLDPASPDALAGRKHPLHTLLPAFMAKGDTRVALGVMGGLNQAQADAQIVSDVADFGLGLQAALEAPRFSRPGIEGCEVFVEDRVDPAARAALAAMGHRVLLRGDEAPEATGGGQAVARDASTGVNAGASDPRKDGEAVPEPAWAGPPAR